MKGIVFTSLCEMIEKEFGISVLNEVVEDTTLPSKGVYSAVGNYEASELFQLVGNLSTISKVDASKLVHAYGRYFFDILHSGYPIFFECDNCFEFFKSIDSHIHVEVKKLYPDSELPRFEYHEENNVLKLDYFSERRLSKFARGLIERSIEHFDEKISLEEELINKDDRSVRFTLTKE